MHISHLYSALIVFDNELFWYFERLYATDPAFHLTWEQWTNDAPRLRVIGAPSFMLLSRYARIINLWARDVAHMTRECIGEDATSLLHNQRVTLRAGLTFGDTQAPVFWAKSCICAQIAHRCYVCHCTNGQVALVLWLPSSKEASLSGPVSSRSKFLAAKLSIRYRS